MAVTKRQAREYTYLVLRIILLVITLYVGTQVLQSHLKLADVEADGVYVEGIVTQRMVKYRSTRSRFRVAYEVRGERYETFLSGRHSNTWKHAQPDDVVELVVAPWDDGKVYPADLQATKQGSLVSLIVIAIMNIGLIAGFFERRK